MQNNDDPTEGLSVATKAIHGKRTGAFDAPLVLPIHQTSTYRFSSSDSPLRYSRGEEGVYVYSRYHNPSFDEVEEKIALINNAEKAALFASGMAAITTTILSLVKSGEHIVSASSLYGVTYRFFRDELPAFNISTSFIRTSDISQLGKSIAPNTAIVYFETPTNPTLDIVDIRSVVAQVRDRERELNRKIIIVIDNTFASGINQQPLALGVDVIVESATKYLGGHHDLLAGVVSSSTPTIKRIKTSAKFYGGCSDPFAAFLLARSLKTLDVRIQRQNENAMILARSLEQHPRVRRVLYPGLPSHPQHSITCSQMNGFGGMLTIEVAPSGNLKPLEAAARVTEALRIAVNASSLGGVETLVSIPVYTSHISMSDIELASHGVTTGMIRISVGLEHINDILTDFERALNTI